MIRMVRERERLSLLQHAALNWTRGRVKRSYIEPPHVTITEGRPLLQSWRSRRRCDLKTLPVLQAIGSPRHRLEPLLFDASTVDDAPAERAIGHTAQRVAHLLQHIRILFGFGKFL